MKKILVLLIAAFSLLLLIGCNSNESTPALLAGNYVAVGDYEEMLTPYFFVNTEKNEFTFGCGVAMSYAEFGTYEVENEELIAASQRSTYRFEIKDEKTLVWLENAGDGYFSIPIYTQFVLNDN